MKLKNTTDYPDYFLRRMLAWCCRELDLPARCVRGARFHRSRSLWGGRAYLHLGSISVRLGECHYPQKMFRHGNGLQHVINDREELLVVITAHELAHLEQYQRRTRTRQGGLGGSEQITDRMAGRILEAFRANREQLMAAWSVPPAERAAKPKPSITDRRAEKAAADLERWQKKLKLAQTKIRKYKQRVRYYERKQAASPKPKVTNP